MNNTKIYKVREISTGKILYDSSLFNNRGVAQAKITSEINHEIRWNTEAKYRLDPHDLEIVEFEVSYRQTDAIPYAALKSNIRSR